MRILVVILCFCFGLLAPKVARAQEEAVVEQLAPVLAAEDARQWRPELFQRALVAPDSVVRRVAAMAAGRIGDLRATPLLLQLLDQPDSTVRVTAAFALGLLRDSSALGPLIEQLTGLPPLDTATAAEVVTAIAKIGGRRGAEFFASVLLGKVALSQVDPAPAFSQILLESWRLGAEARADALLPFADDTVQGIRWRAVYSLGRLRAPTAANHLIAALRADDAATRAVAARALIREYADTAKLTPATVAGLLTRAIDDPDAGVRINAIRSLGSYRDSTVAAALVSRLDDSDPNVRVQTASTLGEIGGSLARAALKRVLAGKGGYALRREALLGLARADPGGFAAAAGPWRTGADWRDRAAAAEGWALAGAKGAPWFTADRDGRVIAAGLQAWADVVQGPDRALVEAARSLLTHPDAAARSVAADVLTRAADPADLGPLIQMYTRSTRDSFPEASLSALNAIAAIRRRGEAARSRVDREFLQSVPRPANYLLRRWAEANWSEASERWGPAYPVATGRTLQDYRELARQFLLAPDSIARPHVVIETEQRGVLEIELFGPDAPLTVANFLRLVDRRFFDGNRWHRVVPNFVVQDGDPRGDGFGGPGGAIRDEINRNRYGIKPMLGMALSGPDTGSSQWFINLAPQPHLDGTYTVFGRAVGNYGPLNRITQGDVIRTVRR
ncbi:MAG TPA: HEAT repeat domain-containing protein [Gemmatimonadales bacterium]|jgi:cyclophilin family peptidyl-prolyl cis-trans isomerase/HEAT repeat protein